MVLFVYDATDPESFEKLQDTISELKKLSPQLSGLVCSNKMDLEELIRVDPKDGYQLAVNFDLDFVQTSSFRATNTNINNDDVLNKLAGMLYIKYEQHLEKCSKLFM
mmetsp:Transcript_66214/g.142910  ORF Transcript_66214/g.142910 Transcript_66214/m.142910 type:complete len:107 (+) Transcript_66214:274-594(+)|eukprot:CAMPEP_0116919670 /NCGR_PEP_ID=MMETSP0467-20121206/20532_1 /TAXON_ID=283647 /ORGANISM="Mesodinium pulex, Strain SPMC105" /LENGTH=106 /DNA_ID=CAMNT_0004597309 /DNA_START=274 /DNA_END=594 /DNA_ORIENTATION=+